MATPTEHDGTKRLVDRRLEELEPSPAIVVHLSKVVLSTTVFAMLVAPLLITDLPYWAVVLSTAPFTVVYASCWYMAVNGRTRVAAWTFVAGTLFGQIGALLSHAEVSEQALVSTVNLILCAGFMLGRRAAIGVSAVCISLILVYSRASLFGWFIEPVVVAGPSLRVLALVSTLMATAGITYVGIQHMVSAIQQARKSEARMADANRALQLATAQEERRALRAERIGTLAKNLVGMKDPTDLSQEVAIGLRDALSADVVMVLDRTGRLIAAAGLGGRSEEVPLQFQLEASMPAGSGRDLGGEQLDWVREVSGIDALSTGVLMRAPNAPFFLLVAGEPELHEAVLTLQVGVSLLDAALVRHESEQRAVQAQKMDAIHRLSAGIAHDFNNLLTTILGGTEIAEFKAGTQDPIIGHLRRIREAGERASALTSKLMTFTRTAPRAATVFDLSTLLSGLMPVLRRTVEENIQLVTHFDESSGLWVDGDVIEVERIVFNLVANARDALEGSGQIDIGAEIREGEPNMVVLWVQDDGEGMGLDIRSRMFEPFFTTRKGKGATGLGMSIVYGVVQGIGGEVFVDTAQGRGTCVEVHLKLAQEPERVVRTEVIVKPELQGLRVLVVEDAPDVRETLCEMLELGGYAVEAVGSGADAMERLEGEGQYHLVLSDVVMPKMGGFELAVRMDEGAVDVPFCLVSGYAAQSDADSRSRKIPRITKPFSLDELLSFVAQNISS